MPGLIALLLLGAINACNAQYGSDWGPNLALFADGTWIREANTTLVLPHLPSPVQNQTILWVGMETHGNDFLQARAVSPT